MIERRGRILICQRHDHDSFGGCWEFPGGKCELGESWEACLRRELHEELGVAIRAVTPYGWMRHEFTDGIVAFRVFRCGLARGRPRPLDAQAIRWIQVTELTRYKFPPANRALIARLIRRRKRA